MGWADRWSPYVALFGAFAAGMAAATALWVDEAWKVALCIGLAVVGAILVVTLTAVREARGRIRI